VGLDQAVTERRRGVALTPMETRRDIILQAGVLADELGYEVFTVPEGWGLDSTPVVAELALRTRRLRLVSGVLSIWSRTPALLAMTAATLYRLAGGRYVLGLGASTRALAEGFHDRPFVQPADRLRDTVSSVRALLAGEPARLQHPSTARPIRLGQPAVPDLPIWLAALGRRTLAVTAELADGWIPIFVARDRLPAWREELRRLRTASGKSGAPPIIATGPICAVDQNPATARRIVAGVTAWYLCAMGDVYPRLVASQGYAGAVEAIRAANPRPRPDDGIIPLEAETVLEQFTAYGRPTQLRDQLEAFDALADIVLLGLPAGLPWGTLEATLRAGAP
jgi:alkanesulfonate monooxygenase SsuD/methylene tetrahydromethanopterin reductase-like flavin-dependent oxidoreductase (luciferase family)